MLDWLIKATGDTCLSLSEVPTNHRAWRIIDEEQTQLKE